MSHLASFRKGWESENLARFILYKFSFIAHPATVSDDIGSDYFCTLFHIHKEGRHDYLIPKNSFGIQIKSDTKDLDATNKIEYLANLEIPLFIGVVDRNSLCLSIYSGEYLPAFISFKGLPNNLNIRLIERSELQKSGDYFIDNGNESYTLLFPKVVDICANVSRYELNQIIQILSNLCSLIQDNISSKRNHEYIFAHYGGGPDDVFMFAGPGSVQYFRQNYFKRLTEVFYNLEWLLNANPEAFDINEFRIYRYQYEQLKSHYGRLPGYLDFAFNSLINRLKQYGTI